MRSVRCDLTKWYESIAWTKSPPNHRSRTCLKKGNLIGHDLARGNVSRSSDRDPTEASWCVFNAYIWSFIGSVHSRSEGRNLIITVRHYTFHLDRWWRLNASIGRLRPIRLKNYVFFNFVRHSRMYSSNWPIYTPPSLNLSLLISSRLVSASTEWLKVRFRRSIMENLSLEHRYSRSKSRNE